MKCTVCGGKDEHCKSCGGDPRGIRITDCPKKMVDGRIWRLIDLATFATKGAFPITGGVLDQSDSFMRGCQLVWAEESHYRGGPEEE